MKKTGSSRPSHREVHGTTAKVLTGGRAATLALMMLGALSLMAQDRPFRPDAVRNVPEGNMIRKPPVKAKLNRTLLETPTRPALAFKAFAMVDPKTNKAIPPTATIALPNGKKVNAQQYYSELNTFEKWLTDHGYTLRNTKRGSAIQLHQVHLDRVSLQRQVSLAPKPTALVRKTNFLAVYSNKNLSAAQPLQLNTNHVAIARIPQKVDNSRMSEINRNLAAKRITGVQRDGLVISNLGDLARLEPRNMKLPPAAQCKPIQDNRSWNWDVGNPDTFHAYVNGALKISGEACKPPDIQKFDDNQSHFNVSAEGKAGGTVFGIGGDLLRATGNLGGNEATRTVTAGLGIFVLGQDILNINKTATGHWGVDDKISKGVDFSTSIPIPVGPFDIDVTVGARGEAGFEYSMSLYPMSVSLSGGPFVHTSVYAQGGLNVVVAEAGVGVTLTLVNWDMNLGGSAGVGWLFGFFVYDDVYADSNLNLLSGNVYVYAKVYYPCFDPFPDICDSQFQTNLWSWNGLQFNSVLFEQKNVYALNW